MLTRKEAANLFKKANVNIVGARDGQIIVGVEKKLPKSLLDSKDIVPAYMADMPTDVIETGKIRALLTRTDKWRPAPGGVSIGHYAITAGTLGMVVLKDGKKMILSNCHVLANSNDANIGDEIRQPGSYDGNGSADRIGYLHSFVPIKFQGDDDSGCIFSRGFAQFWNGVWWMLGRTTRFRTYDSAVSYNFVDAALAIPDKESDLRDDILDIGIPKRFGEVVVGDKVCKSGRTTEYTEGTVNLIDAYVSVGYGDGKVAYFMDQIVTTNMLAGGDSGSHLMAIDKETSVGLCFAGSNEISIMNKISHVRELLGGFECV